MIDSIILKYSHNTPMGRPKLLKGLSNEDLLICWKEETDGS
nr:MAG TPA: hypothetical protein [Caudoviricetes sp.]